MIVVILYDECAERSHFICVQQTRQGDDVKAIVTNMLPMVQQAVQAKFVEISHRDTCRDGLLNPAMRMIKASYEFGSINREYWIECGYAADDAGDFRVKALSFEGDSIFGDRA